MSKAISKYAIAKDASAPPITRFGTVISFKHQIDLQHQIVSTTQRLQRHAILFLTLKRHP